MLLTITFDPERDTPEVLAAYASQWKADPKTWHFLTGPVADVRKVCALFGVESFPDEGLMNHSLRTAVIDRRGHSSPASKATRTRRSSSATWCSRS